MLVKVGPDVCRENEVRSMLDIYQCIAAYDIALYLTALEVCGSQL